MLFFLFLFAKLLLLVFVITGGKLSTIAVSMSNRDNDPKIYENIQLETTLSCPEVRTIMSKVSLLKVAATALALSLSPKVASAANCTSSDPLYVFEYTPFAGLTLYWSSNETKIDAKLKYNGTAWLSIGPSYGGLMVGSEPVVGLPLYNTVRFTLYRFYPPNLHQQFFSTATGFTVCGFRIFCFLCR